MQVCRDVAAKKRGYRCHRVVEEVHYRNADGAGTEIFKRPSKLSAQLIRRSFVPLKVRKGACGT